MRRGRRARSRPILPGVALVVVQSCIAPLWQRVLCVRVRSISLSFAQTPLTKRVWSTHSTEWGTPELCERTGSTPHSEMALIQATPTATLVGPSQLNQRQRFDAACSCRPSAASSVRSRTAVRSEAVAPLAQLTRPQLRRHHRRGRLTVAATAVPGASSASGLPSDAGSCLVQTRGWEVRGGTQTHKLSDKWGNLSNSSFSCDPRSRCSTPAR